MANLEELGVFEQVDELPQGKKVLGTLPIFKEAYDEDGNV